MGMIRVISKIVTCDGEILRVGSNDADGMVVEEINHRRDGITGIFKDEKDQAHYEVTLMDPINDKMVSFAVIPQREVKRVVYIIEKPKKKDKVPTGEAEVVLEKVD